DRVDLEGLRQLGQGPGLLDGFQGDLGLEGGRVALLTCVGHDEPRDATVTFDQFNIPSGPGIGVHFSLRADLASDRRKYETRARYAGVLAQVRSSRLDHCRSKGVRHIDRANQVDSQHWLPIVWLELPEREAV